MILLSFYVQNYCITSGFLIVDNKVHSSLFKQKSLYYSVLLTLRIWGKSRELNLILNSQNDPTRRYA